MIVLGQFQRQFIFAKFSSLPILLFPPTHQHGYEKENFHVHFHVHDIYIYSQSIEFEIHINDNELLEAIWEHMKKKKIVDYCAY
jgi:hypothetical protein